jgi:hypothetical protein
LKHGYEVDFFLSYSPQVLKYAKLYNSINNITTTTTTTTTTSSINFAYFKNTTASSSNFKVVA